MEKLYTKIIWAVVFLLVGLSIPSFAQVEQTLRQRIHSGRVIDSGNQGIQGVTVSIQESNLKTLTDASGSFSIEALDTDILIFKKEGYLSTTRDLSLNTRLEISMEEAKILAGDDDYVQLPHGLLQKRYLTGAVSSIKTSELPQPSTGSLTNVLSGRLPGLNVVQLGTQPGADFSTYRVRGRDSFNHVDALIIVDGIERDFADLDFEEIESFTVLKDAATLSWYGLRGSNGVILVTTKTGNSTESSIGFNAQYGLQVPDHLMDPLNSYEYASLYNEAML
ncbi:MAG TPA: TonB-dependent receptor plug domain-containing protein, partial [Cyclobacteriaceae bacterium]|nr:TonB-dependent receptor plug domain-containing protein [Cyclobacteriaceae bacterium]